MVTTVTTLWKVVLDLWSRHARLLPCLWCEPKGVLRICGDSGDDDDKNHGPRLMEVLGADRSEGGLWNFERQARGDQSRLCGGGRQNYPECDPKRRRIPIPRTRPNKGVLRPAEHQRNRVLRRPRLCCRWCQSPHAHLPCHGHAIAPNISSARPETHPSSKMASLVAENTAPPRLTYVSTALGPTKHLFEGVQ
jgi:hypothetical protein